MVAIYGHKWASHLGGAMDGQELSEAAKTWQSGLSGLTVEHIKNGFSALIEKRMAWPPSLPEFRSLCVNGDAPSLDEAVDLLVTLSMRSGSLSDRYRHSLIFAIATDRSIDTFFLRTSTKAEAKIRIKPVYEKLISSGWPDWPEHAHDHQKAISVNKALPNKDAVTKHFRAMRGALA